MASFADDTKKEQQVDPSLKTKHFLALEKKIESLSALGSVLIAGIEQEGDDEDEDDDEDEEDDDVCYTEEQIKGLRHIIITANREKQIERCTYKFGGGDGFVMSNTHTGNETIHYIPIVIKKSMKKKSLPETFDALFAMTYAINNFDTWMYDNEEYGAGGKCDQAIRALAKAWRKLLAHSDEELGIDTEYTRPGIVDLLNKFKENIVNIPDQQYRFNWDGSFDDEEDEEEDEEGDEHNAKSNDLEDDDDESDSDDSEDEDEEWGDEEGDYVDMACDDEEFLENEEDSEIPKELLQKAMDAYKKVVVNIPEDSDSD